MKKRVLARSLQARLYLDIVKTSYKKSAFFTLAHSRATVL